MARTTLAIGVGCLLALAVLELLLWTAPELPGQRLANFIHTRYGTFPGGMYVREPTTGATFLRPKFSTNAYWNGYRWHHQTDERGFRNPSGPAVAGAQRRPILLGDSLIYGHGVEANETATQALRQVHDVGAYDMSRQGACLFDHYLSLRTFLPELDPTAVVLFVFLNDFADLEGYRSPAELAAPPELDLDYAAIRQWVREIPNHPSNPVAAWLATRPSLRLLVGMVRAVGAVSLVSPAWAAAPADPDHDPDDFAAAVSDPNRFAPLRHYYEVVITDLAARLDERGIALHLVYLSSGSDPHDRDHAQTTTVALLGDLGTRVGASSFDTRPLFAGCTSCFLPGDGHYTAQGHRRLADFLVREVLRTKSDPLQTPDPTEPRWQSRR